MTDATDPRPHLRTAAAVAARVVAGVKADQLGDPTPCREWDVTGLLDHLLGVAERVAELGNRLPVTEITAHGLAPDQWGATFAAAADAAVEAWGDRSRLDEMVALPFATLPGAVVVGLYTAELTTHAWDLATATDQTVEWDDAAARFGYEAVAPLFVDAPGGDEFPFDPAVAVPADAPAVVRLVALQGRRP